MWMTKLAPTMSSQDSSMRLLLTNAFIAQNKIGELQHSILLHNVDVAVVTETKFGEDTTDMDVSISGYSLFRRDRNCHGGGVAIRTKAELSVAHHTHLSSDHHEILWISVSTHDSSIVIGAMYRPGSCQDSDTTLIDHQDEVLDDARKHGNNIILAGDFNVHSGSWIPSEKTTAAGNALKVFCAGHNLTQHVQQPTRGNAALDSIMSDFPDPVETTVHAPLGRSDHAIVLSNFKTPPQRQDLPTKRMVWRYTRADWCRMRAQLKQTNWTAVITGNPEQSCQNLTNTTLENMKQFIPNKQLCT